MVRRSDQQLRKLRPSTQKILLLLFTGASLGLTRSPQQHFHILKSAHREWQRINRYALHRAIKALYRSRLVTTRENNDGSVEIILTKSGKEHALIYHTDAMRIPVMKKWDHAWRIVMFDIPEKQRGARDALARQLKNMTFYQLQKSVFVHPFECVDEIDFIIEFFDLRPYVRFVRAQYIDTELHLKKHFGLV